MAWIRCPQTGEPLATRGDDERVREVGLGAVQCPHCGGTHGWWFNGDQAEALEDRPPHPDLRF